MPTIHDSQLVSSKPSQSAPRTAADLLELDYVFGQRSLLTAEEFIEQAERRGVKLQLGHLEALHRSGHLVPMYRVRLGRGGIVEPWQPGDYHLFRPGTSLEDLRRLYREGRLRIVTDEGFRSWSRDRITFAGRPFWLSAYLYSAWQLLSLFEISRLLPTMRTKGRASFGHRYGVTGRVTSSTPVTSALVVALSALEPVYYPQIVGNLHYAGDAIRPGDLV